MRHQCGSRPSTSRVSIEFACGMMTTCSPIPEEAVYREALVNSAGGRPVLRRMREQINSGDHRHELAAIEMVRTGLVLPTGADDEEGGGNEAMLGRARVMLRVLSLESSEICQAVSPAWIAMLCRRMSLPTPCSYVVATHIYELAHTAHRARLRGRHGPGAR